MQQKIQSDFARASSELLFGVAFCTPTDCTSNDGAVNAKIVSALDGWYASSRSHNAALALALARQHRFNFSRSSMYSAVMTDKGRDAIVADLERARELLSTHKNAIGKEPRALRLRVLLAIDLGGPDELEAATVELLRDAASDSEALSVFRRFHSSAEEYHQFALDMEKKQADASSGQTMYARLIRAYAASKEAEFAAGAFDWTKVEAGNAIIHQSMPRIETALELVREACYANRPDAALPIVSKYSPAEWEAAIREWSPQFGCGRFPWETVLSNPSRFENTAPLAEQVPSNASNSPAFAAFLAQAEALRTATGSALDATKIRAHCEAVEANLLPIAQEILGLKFKPEELAANQQLKFLHAGEHCQKIRECTASQIDGTLSVDQLGEVTKQLQSPEIASLIELLNRPNLEPSGAFPDQRYAPVWKLAQRLAGLQESSVRHDMLELARSVDSKLGPMLLAGWVEKGTMAPTIPLYRSPDQIVGYFDQLPQSLPETVESLTKDRYMTEFLIARDSCVTSTAQRAIAGLTGARP